MVLILFAPWLVQDENYHPIAFSMYRPSDVQHSYWLQQLGLPSVTKVMHTLQKIFHKSLIHAKHALTHKHR